MVLLPLCQSPRIYTCKNCEYSDRGHCRLVEGGGGGGQRILALFELETTSLDPDYTTEPLL